jgi:hypothetical protein
MDIIYYVYLLTFPNGKIYVGMSKTKNENDFSARYKDNKNAAGQGRKLPIYNGWRKHGDPVQSIISKHNNRADCAASEIESIKALGATDIKRGYNLQAGGQGLQIDGNPVLYQLMSEKVWDNVERRRKSSEALKGKKPSQACADASAKFKKTDAGKQSYLKGWESEDRRKNAAERTRLQMANGGSEHLRLTTKGRTDPRSAEGKAAQIAKITAIMNSERGKAVARAGQAKMWSNPENVRKVKAATDAWRATDENKENCKRMALLSAAKCSRKVRFAGGEEVFNSQRALGQSVGVTDATVTHWVKSGKVVRV